MSRDEAIVIGAGPNGLTAGALLAREGFSVTILEAQSEVGGSARSEEFHPGYWTGGLLHDTSGLRPAVIDELELEKHGLELGGPPDMFVPTVDGRGLLVAHDAQQAIAEIQQHSAGDAERYVEFRAFFDRVRGFAARVLDGMPPDVLADPSAGELLGPAWALRRLGRKDMMEVLRLGPMCAADWLNEWFEGELLKCALAQPALLGTFMGPWSPGSNTNLLRHEALTGRAAQRGPHAVVAALVAAAMSSQSGPSSSPSSDPDPDSSDPEPEAAAPVETPEQIVANAFPKEDAATQAWIVQTVDTVVETGNNAGKTFRELAITKSTRRPTAGRTHPGLPTVAWCPARSARRSGRWSTAASASCTARRQPGT